MSIFVFVSFSAVNGISFSSAFSFTAENEKCFRSASSIHHKKVLVLVLKISFDYITGYGLWYPAQVSLRDNGAQRGALTHDLILRVSCSTD